MYPCTVSGLHPGQLKDEVTSPKGSTIEAVRALEKAGLRFEIFDHDDNVGQNGCSDDHHDIVAHDDLLDDQDGSIMLIIKIMQDGSPDSSNHE